MEFAFLSAMVSIVANMVMPALLKAVLKNLFLSLVLVGSFVFHANAAEKCAAYLSLVGQSGFADAIREISEIRTFGILKTHKVVVLQNPETNQVVVLLGEGHFKKPGDTDTVEAFAKRFGNIAVELVERENVDREYRKLWAANASSNIARSLLLDSPEHRVHLIDKELPAVLKPHNVLLVMIGGLTFYMGYANVAMFTSNGSAELLLHKLAVPPPIVSVPLNTAAIGLYLYALDGMLGTIGHLINIFKVGRFMPLTNNLLNKRNVFMAQKIADLMSDSKTRRENLLAIVGRVHLQQMIVEMKRHGFQEVAPESSDVEK